MSTSLKSSPPAWPACALADRLRAGRNTIFRLPVKGAEKNDRPTGPINDDLGSTLTWTTPQNSLCTRPACLACLCSGRQAAGRRSSHHDA